jgi:hypothetical protein
MADLAAKKAEIEGRLADAQKQKQQADQVANQATIAILACQANLELLAELEANPSDTEEPEQCPTPES